jgi:redox-sensitive bicupin YhaK (pirin superfamily)
MQFWINLPAKIKAEAPEYIAVQANEVPQKALSEGKGWIKVIAGKYEDLSSPIPSYSHQFLYHIHVAAGQTFTINTEKDTEYGALLPLGDANINDSTFKSGEFIEFDRNEGFIEIVSEDQPADVILFGGEPYKEPIVAEGPFVMNSKAEIAIAYRDFFNGNYGRISYDKSVSL